MTSQPPLAPTSSLVLEDGRDLSEDQIEQLLHEAEHRLRSQREMLSSPTIPSPFIKPRARLPQLKSGGSTFPYIKHKDGIAVVDAARLLDNEHRKLANLEQVVVPTPKADSKVGSVPVANALLLLA